MFHYTKTVFHSGIYILWCYFTWMIKYSKHPEKYDYNKRYKHLSKLLRNVAHGFQVDFHVEGKENIPNEVSCFVSNHLSSFDPLALISVIDTPTTFVAKKEVEKMPFVGKCVKCIDGLFLDREDLKQSLRVMMKVEEDFKTKKNKNWIIFPEGTRNQDQMHNLREFHHGTFRPAVKAGVPIVPVALYGTFRAMKLKPQYKKYHVYVKFLKPIYPEEYKNMTTQEIAKLAQDRIDQAVSYELRQKDHLEMSKYNKNYRFNKII